MGGSISAEGQFPWYAASAGTLFCGASLVHADILLTAAHCQDVLTVASGVFVGSNRKGQGAVYRRIRQALVHPLYDATTLQRDYMLLKLSSPITDITPVPLNEQNSVPVDGQLLTLMGFGKNGDDGNLTTTLRDVEVVAMNHDLCARQYANVTGFDGVTTVQLDAAVDLCAGVPQGGKGQCQGDSGMLCCGVCCGVFFLIDIDGLSSLFLLLLFSIFPTRRPAHYCRRRTGGSHFQWQWMCQSRLSGYQCSCERSHGLDSSRYL